MKGKYKKGNRQYRLQFSAYCGMAYTVGDDMNSPGDARTYAAHEITRMRRKGYCVSVLKIGREWEFTEPEDAMMVPDDAGILTLQSRKF